MGKGIEREEDDRGGSGKTPFVNFRFFHFLCFLCIFLIRSSFNVLGWVGQLVIIVVPCLPQLTLSEHDKL